MSRRTGNTCDLFGTAGCTSSPAFDLDFAVPPAPLQNSSLAHLRTQGVWCIIYVDDILIMHQSKEILQHQVQLIVHLLESLGFIINGDKSQLDPSQEIQFLGFQTNEVLPSGGENTRHCSSLPGDSGPGKVVNSTTVTTFGQVERRLPSGPISPNTLPSTATVVTQKVEVIRHTGDLRPKSSRGATMVERSIEELEREGHSSPTSRHGDRNRCLQH